MAARLTKAEANLQRLFNLRCRDLERIAQTGAADLQRISRELTTAAHAMQAARSAYDTSIMARATAQTKKTK